MTDDLQMTRLRTAVRRDWPFAVGAFLLVLVLGTLSVLGAQARVLSEVRLEAPGLDADSSLASILREKIDRIEAVASADANVLVSRAGQDNAVLIVISSFSAIAVSEAEASILRIIDDLQTEATRDHAAEVETRVESLRARLDREKAIFELLLERLTRPRTMSTGSFEGIGEIVGTLRATGLQIERIETDLRSAEHAPAPWIVEVSEPSVSRIPTSVALIGVLGAALALAIFMIVLREGLRRMKQAPLESHV